MSCNQFPIGSVPKVESCSKLIQDRENLQGHGLFASTAVSYRTTALYYNKGITEIKCHVEAGANRLTALQVWGRDTRDAETPLDDGDMSIHSILHILVEEVTDTLY
jgi:hypothetical protein